MSSSMVIRAARPQDVDQLIGVDTSFETLLLFEVHSGVTTSATLNLPTLKFELIPTMREEPFRKTYSVDFDELFSGKFAVLIAIEICASVDQAAIYPRTLIADVSDAIPMPEPRSERIVGYAAVRHDEWNNRAVLEHLYVDKSARGRSVGAQLLTACEQIARDSLRARCLWLETQNVNTGAVQFYMRHGYSLCGLDTTLYGDPHCEHEVALFFAKSLRSAD